MEAFSSDLRRAHRDVLAGAPTAVDTPAAVLTPPPLPPHAAHQLLSRFTTAVQPAPGPRQQSSSTYDAVAGTIRVRSSIHGHTRPARDSARAAVMAAAFARGARSGRRPHRHRDRVHGQLDAHLDVRHASGCEPASVARAKRNQRSWTTSARPSRTPSPRASCGSAQGRPRSR